MVNMGNDGKVAYMFRAHHDRIGSSAEGTSASARESGARINLMREFVTMRNSSFSRKKSTAAEAIRPAIPAINPCVKTAVKVVRGAIPPSNAKTVYAAAPPAMAATHPSMHGRASVLARLG